MAAYHPPEPTSLIDKVIVLTGGASGICAALVRLCHSHGAHCFFSDVQSAPGRALEQELRANGRKNHAVYVQADAASYTDTLRLFDVALNTCRRIDHAVSAAAIGEKGALCGANLTLESIRHDPRAEMATLNIDLVGPMYFSRIASVYLRQGSGEGDKSLTLVSSVAGITETPGLTVYSTAKHGVIGLMRALRKPLIGNKECPIRTNAICPWMTKTAMVQGIEDAWHEAELPTNEAVDVAKIIAGVIADRQSNGGSFYVEGGNAWEIEEGYDRTQPQWMGEKQCRDFLRGQEVLGMGDDWQKTKHKEAT